MKITMIAAAVGSCLAAVTANAQFTGKLVYQIVKPTVILTMTYYQNGNNVHVEAYSMEVKKGVVDSSTFSVQDTILFDLSKGTETHLQRQTGNAIISPYTMTILAQTRYGQMSTPVTVQQAETDTVNGYSCTHYIENSTGAKPFGSTRRDLWVTNALGTPGIAVMGSYLYYTPGSQPLQALYAAGGTGVIVRAKISAIGQTAVMNLIGVDTKTPGAALFQVPSNYVIIDRSGYVAPKLGVKAPPPLKNIPKQ